MIKKSKVTNVQANGTWEGKFGLMYKFEVEMENGDTGEYSSKSKDQDKFVTGQEVDYEFIGGNFPKVKPVYQQPKSFGGGFKEDPNRQKLIIRQSSLRSAVEYLKGAEASLEEVFEEAEKMINWVNEKPKQTNTSNTAKAMHDFAKNPTGNNNNDDLPF